MWSFSCCSSSTLRFGKVNFLWRRFTPSSCSDVHVLRKMFISTSRTVDRWTRKGKYNKLKSPDNFAPNDNQILYRFRWMKHIRFVSRVKILHVAAVTSLTWPISYWYFCGVISLNSFICAVTGAAGTTAGLVALSNFFRRVIGELYFHEATQQVTISSMTFWGNRRNRTFPLESLVPISDSGIDLKNTFHRFEVNRCKDGSKDIYLLNLRHCKIFHEKFFTVTGLPMDVRHVISQVEESVFSPKKGTP